jgi:uncharacterized DUF497 family protein
MTNPLPVQFEWDERKAAVNRRKHGLSFETAILVFNDPYSKTEIDDTEHGELRWRTIGLASETLIVVVHTRIETDECEIIRIVSARKTTRREHRDFEENP